MSLVSETVFESNPRMEFSSSHICIALSLIHLSIKLTLFITSIGIAQRISVVPVCFVFLFQEKKLPLSPFFSLVVFTPSPAPFIVGLVLILS